MPDWSQSMQQTYEYYTVDPHTWADKDPIRTVRSSSISRDLEAETICSATFDVDETLGENYVRVYLVTIQNGVTERFPLGTFLVQTPSTKFDGKVTSISVDAYSPLLELKEKVPPLGYTIYKNNNIMEVANELTNENLRAPVVEPTCDKTLYSHFVADVDDNWLGFIIDLLAMAKYKFSVDEMGRILFAPDQETDSLQPIWTFNDDNSSILYPDITIDKDLYGIPNVVEVVLSDKERSYTARAVNDDPGSPISTVNRGREIVKRIANPDIADGHAQGKTLEEMVKLYAIETLKEESSLDCRIMFEHGYCPVRLGDCVRLNYERAGVVNVKAKIVNQSIDCVPGCPVTEEAVFTTKLWEG